MENKKLINILLKDIGELETLIFDMKEIRQYDALAMELAHNRTQSIMHLLQLLKKQEKNEQPGNTVEPEPEREKEQSIAPSFTNAPAATVQSDQNDLSGSIQTESQNDISSLSPHTRYLEYTNKSENINQTGDPTDKVQVTSNEKIQKEEDQSEVTEEPAASSEPEEKTGSHVTGEQSEGNDMLEEESQNKDLHLRLIDSFLKGKSVNDLITDQHKLEFKLSNRPVSSIQKAIGINDRFQYIRELFDNDSERFLQTVKSIDSMQTATEAYQFLRTRYKWQKNETSLKFLHLVKRRFSNETNG